MNDIAIIPGKFSFIATTPAQMEVAQKDMIRWCDERVEREKIEIAELERTVSEAQNAGLKTHAWKARMAKCRAKMTFYRKVKAALLAGYYILPPLDVDVFAIRTNLQSPKGNKQNYRSDFEQKEGSLEEGKGQWRSPIPQIFTTTYPEKDKTTGNLVDKRYWWPESWNDLDFPFKMVKPEVIAATGKALQEKIFDALGVLPKFRHPDPIVVGQIRIPHKPYQRITFFVAWWMNVDDL